MKRVIFSIFFLTHALWSQPTVVAVFGSPTCPWSFQLQEEVWKSASFQTLLKEAGMQPRVRKATGSEPETPLLMLLSSQGKEIGYLGYLPIPPEKYVALFEEMLQIENLTLHLKNPTVEQLLLLYRKSRLYNMRASEEKLLNAGLALDPGVHFLLEHYAKLCKDHPRKAKKIKEEIRKRSPASSSVEWQLATLLSEAKHERGEELKEIIRPLEKYLRRYGDQDIDLRWKCHLLLGEIYQEKNQLQQAKDHFRQAVEEAPVEVQSMMQPLGIHD